MTNFPGKTKTFVTVTALAAALVLAAGCGDGNGTPDADDVVETDVADVTDDAGDDVSDVPVVTTGYSAGMGIADVSGETGTMMGGYGFCMNAPDYCRYSEGVHDPLLARAIAVKDNASGEAVIMITTDLVGVLRYDVDLIHAAAPERFLQEFGIENFDGRRIVITATHTHHSTDTMGLWGPLDGSGRDEEYATFMRGRILDAAVAAWADLKPVNIFHSATASAPNYDDDKYADDTGIQTLRFADRTTGETRFTMTRWAAHVTNYPQALKAFSAGHPGTFTKRMEQLTGAPAAYFQGMIGSVYTEGYMFDEPGEDPCVMEDMFPEGYQDPDLQQSFISAMSCLGTGLAERAYADLTNEVQVPETGLTHRFHKFAFHPETKIPVMLDYTMFSYVEMGPLHFEVPPADQIDNPESTMDTQFNWTTIGDIHLITTPGEGFPELGSQIERVLARKGGHVITLGLGQDWLGYIPSWQQWRDNDDNILYNKALSGGQYLQARYLEELQTMVTTETGVGPECTGTEMKCTDDGYKVVECHSGLWFETTDCMATAGQLCEAPGDGTASCVDSWKWGSPVWDKCENNPAATAESLGQKATYYDDIAQRLHYHPQLKWIAEVTLPKQEVECNMDEAGPCYQPAVAEAEATWEDVERWHTGENDGLWSALYLASQAYRYAVTKDAASLEMIRNLMEGEKWRMEITGVPGLFTRQYIPTGVEGIACPADLASYVPDDIKDDNKWLRIADDGCIETVDGGTMEWVKHDFCVPVKYAGWCLLDNVSQDEYAGHMFALGAIWKLVDDPQIKADAANLLGQIGQHLMNNWMHFIDWDGRDTEHGKMNIYSFADSPGFLAIHSLDFILMAAEATGRQDLRDFYDNCLLQKASGPCEGWPYPEPAYDTEIANLILYNGAEFPGCKSNYNNFSMVFAAIHHLAWFLKDSETKEIVQDAWENHFMDEGSLDRALVNQSNPWFNFGFAAMKKIDATHPHAVKLVEDGICSLREFRASQHEHFGNSAATYPGYCESRFDDQFQTEYPVPVGERCAATFEWWGDPYSRETCSEAPWNVNVPTGYLLPYWMGRFYGFIGADM